MITGKDVRKALHDVSLDPGANANERERLGHVSYYLRESTADIIATLLNNLEPPPISADYAIWSNEHQAWWKPGGHGYTVYFDQAGRYSRAKALQIAADARGGWSPGKPPPEIAIPWADAFAAEELTASRRAGL